jgi:hypothetical protein
MADVASKQQRITLVSFTIVTGTRRHTELKKKLKKLMENQRCARGRSFFGAVVLQG